MGNATERFAPEPVLQVAPARESLLACISIATLLLPGCASRPVPNQLGKLPPGYVSRQELEAVRMEIVVSLLVDSAVAAEYIPADLTPATLQRIATQDSATAQFLASRPHMKSAVSGALMIRRCRGMW